jgi:hypothetical protein
MKGLHLDYNLPYWEAGGETDFPRMLRALSLLVPHDAILYFEGGSPSGELLTFLQEHSIPEQTHVAYGTIWPRPKVFHIPAKSESLQRLAEIAESLACPELAIHFHVYRQEKMLLEWHDAFSQELLIASCLPEESVRRFCEAVNLKPQYRTP